MPVDGLIETAEAMFKAGNFNGAERIAQQVLDDDPDARDGLLMLSLIRDERKDYEGAVELQRRIIERDPHDEDARAFYITSLVRLDREAARQALVNFKRDFPNSDHSQVITSIISMVRVDKAKMKADAEKLREERGDCAEVNFIDALVALGESRNADAYRSAALALEKDPFDAAAHDMAATAAFWSLRPRLSRRHAAETLKYAPKSTHMRGLIRLSRTIWFPPMTLAYGIFVGSDMLAGKTSTIVAMLLLVLTFKFVATPVVASLGAMGLPIQPFLIVTLCCLAYLAFELYVMPKIEQSRAKGDLVLKNY